MFIHDSEHSYETMMAEYNLAWRRIKPGGLLLSDDTGRNEAFIDFCKKIGKKPLWTEKGYGMLMRF
jgi:cephalosporin hydroxylase